ncbi:t-SNARE [Amylocystis lapponica]|nr:t-SNARE [Amylocystis lapponica]
MSSASSSSPTTRSRTLLFISYRDSRAGSSRFRRSRAFTAYDDALHDGDEQERLIDSTTPGHVAIDAELPPKWVDVADQVEGILVGTQAKITTLDKLHAKHALPGFSDRSAEEREIEASTTDITKDFRQCHALIQRIASAPQHAFPPSHPSGSRHQELAAKNVQRGLAAKVQELSATFRKKQRVYMEKLQGHAIKKQDLLVASGTVSLRGSEGLSAVDEDVEAAAASRSQTVAQQQMTTGDVDLRMRDRELTEIAKSIAALAELFKDLSVLVIDQGTLLDSVEYNIEQTAAQMEDAVRELDVATRYQKNTGRRKCIFLLLLIIFGLIVALIFKPRRHSVAAPPPPSDVPLAGLRPPLASLCPSGRRARRGCGCAGGSR